MTDEASADPEFEWAVVEIMGHRKHAGRVREEERFGAKMLRVDVPTRSVTIDGPIDATTLALLREAAHRSAGTLVAASAVPFDGEDRSGEAA